MKNYIEKEINNNYLNDYIDYYFNKEKQKFSRLKYKLRNNISKKQSEFNSYNIIESNLNEKFPYINKKLLINRKLINVSLKSIKTDQIKIGTKNNKIFPIKMFENNNIFNNKQNKKNDLRNINNLNNKSNLLSNSQTDDAHINLIRKKSFYSKKSLKKIRKDLKIELNKELIENDKSSKSRKNIVDKNLNKKLKKIRSEIKAKKEKEEEKVIDILYIGNNIFNNCKIKNKTIYDIRPLNKTKERASCHFELENNLKLVPNEIKSNINFNLNANTNSSKKINSNTTNYLTQKSLKYFRNSLSEVYSTNTNFHNNITIKINEDNNTINTTHIKDIKKYELSEQELINKLKFNKDENYKDNINIELNEILDKKNRYKNKKELLKNTFYNNNKNENFNKHFLDFIDLSLLAKEITNNKKYKKNLHSFFLKEGNVTRGEKIKFLKTCYQVQLVKPILSQRAYEFKTTNTTKKIFSPKKKFFPINHFKLDPLKETNLKEINNTKKYLFDLKKNMKIHLTNLVNHLNKEIKYT